MFGITSFADLKAKLSLSEKAWKAVGIGIGLLVLLGVVLFGISKCDNWRTQRAIDKAKANFNGAMANVNAAKDTVANDKVNEAVAVNAVAAAAKDVIAASDATDAKKAEAAKAVADYENAKNANLPTGITEADLRRRLDALDDQQQ